MSTSSSYSTIEVRTLAVQAVEAGYGVTHVAEVFGVSRRTLTYWMERHKKNPVAGLERRKCPGSARPRKAAKVDADFLIRLTASDATQYGFDSNLWTAGRVKQALSLSPETSLSKSVIHERLREAKLAWQKSGRQYFDEGGDDANRVLWLREDWPKIQEATEKHRAILYFEDEVHIACPWCYANLLN